jgi:hypothetical protein
MKKYSFDSLLISIVTTVMCFFSCQKGDQMPTIESVRADSRKNQKFFVSTEEAIKLTSSGIPERKSRNARTVDAAKKEVKEIRNYYNEQGELVFYIIIYDGDQGYVLLSADRRMRPVLGFSEKGSFNEKTENPGIQLWLDKIKENYLGIQKQYKAHIDIVNYWQLLERESSNGRALTEPGWTPESSCEWWANHPVQPTINISHLTHNVVFWHQGIGINRFCPNGITIANCPGSVFDCGNAPTGCGPLAIAQVLKFYHRPTTVNSHPYTAATLTSMNRIVADDCSSTDPNNINASQLVRDVGVEVNATYNTIVPALGIPQSGSGCQTWSLPGETDNFFSNHGFTSFDVDFFSSEPTVRAELLASRPVIAFGSNCSVCLSNQHIWIIDGVIDTYNIFIDLQGYCYENHSVLYQMNWGWRDTEENNGWFAYGNIVGNGTLYNSSNMKAYIIRP